MGLDSLYCGKWRKISMSRRDLDLDRTMPNVELFSYTTICSSFKSIEPLFFFLIIKENLNIKVNLKVQPGTLRKDSLSKAVRGLDFARSLTAVRNSDVTGGLYKLDLSHNNLRYEGDSLGTLMAKLTTLRVLCVDRCGITPHAPPTCHQRRGRGL